MWLMTLRDLQWRGRRFLFSVGATALVFTVTLLLGGLSESLHDEAGRTIRAVGADAWLVKQGASGPFSALTALPGGVVSSVAKQPGVSRADPMVFAFATTSAPRKTDVTVIGYRVGGMGPPRPATGRVPLRDGEALVDSATGLNPGQNLTIGGHQLTVVGTLRGMTLRGGVGDVYLSLTDAQAMFFGGTDIVTTVVTRGRPAHPAALGLNMLDNKAARTDLLHLFSNALRAVDLLRLLLWLVAGAIVGTVVYLSTLDRTQDFAVLKALGVSDRKLLSGLALQAVAVSLVAATVAIVVGLGLAPLFPLSIALPATSCGALVGIALGVGLLACLGGLRRASRVDPAVAFEGP